MDSDAAQSRKFARVVGEGRSSWRYAEKKLAELSLDIVAARKYPNTAGFGGNEG
jgi:hypothetical protein